ncbi:actin filament organization app1 [Trichoderma arundinaceum]|uniref:Actin filament organization app1 n=1 Tax=Trichoderma arundinaceum TaxID=490622 RepID=A0A395NX32_TRIAR|nr:actin filament organization app1 [Trichoderma arundinaceum]
MDSQVLDFIPSEVANEMQTRTRRHQKFDEVESRLVDPKASVPQQLSISNVLNEISTNWNPFTKAIVKGDVVWLFDNTAFKAAEHEPWQAEFIMAVFESEPKCKVADIVAGIAGIIGLADDAEERKTIEERLLPFLWDIQSARTTTVSQGDLALKLGPSGFNGISTNVLKLLHNSKGSFTTKETTCDVEGVEGVLSMKTHFALPEGWGIISDIDDTIKITTTSDPISILKETFINAPSPVPGMPELYAGIKSFLPHSTPWFYLSASPYNLYPFLKGFRDTYYPPGTFILRDSSWKTVSGLLSSLTMGTEEYKVNRMKKIHSWLPKRKLIVFGDSTQSDPEAYGEIYRTFPGWIRMIFIRKDTNSAAFGLAEKNEPQRFEKAFTGIPRDAWHVFENPDECLDIVKKAVKRNS